jgi:flavin-dependent dehydrogenase
MNIAATLTLDQAAARLWDILVVGAGPAGSLTALGLTQRGLAVLLVDKSAFPRWKVCGACLNTRALAMLEQAGLADLAPNNGAVPLSEVQIAVGKERVALGLPGGAALSREALDAALVRAAITAGTHFLPRTMAIAAGADVNGRYIALRNDRQTITAQTRLLVGADGLCGRMLASESGFQSVSVAGSRIGAGAIADHAPTFYRPGTIFMACGASGYVGLVRLEDGRLDIATAFDASAVRDAEGPAAAAERVLHGVNWPVPHLDALAWRGTASLTRRPRRLAGDRVFILGDAAGYVEPFTGEGISWALSGALALTPLAERAARHWNPSLAKRWRWRHQDIVGRQQRTCRAVAQVLRHPRLTAGVIRLLRRFPKLARPLIDRLNKIPTAKAGRR